MIKIGDKVQPTERARLNYKFHELGIDLPITVVNTFERGGIRYLQFLAPDVYGKHGQMILRTWSARNLEAYQEPKPRCKRVSVNTLCVGDQVWSLASESWHTIGVLSAAIAQKPNAQWEGSTYVWRKEKTALQKEESALFSIGRSNPGSGQIRRTLYLSHLLSRADGGDDTDNTMPREGIEYVTYRPDGVSEPRASVCMTRGRDIKPGQRVSFVVAKDNPAGLYYNVGNVGHMINPDIYYMVVTDVTK